MYDGIKRRKVKVFQQTNRHCFVSSRKTGCYQSKLWSLEDRGYFSNIMHVVWKRDHVLSLHVEFMTLIKRKNQTSCRYMNGELCPCFLLPQKVRKCVSTTKRQNVCPRLKDKTLMICHKKDK